MTNLIETILQTLERNLNTKSIMGEPIVIGEITLIPVMDLSFGFGGGEGEGRDDKQGGTGGGGGCGARMSPRAMIVIKGGEVQVVPLAKGGAMEKIVEAIPGLVEKLSAVKEKKAEEKDDD